MLKLVALGNARAATWRVKMGGLGHGSSQEGSAAGDVTLARELAAATARDPAMTSPCVVDLGLTDDRGGLAIEANAAWGAGLNGCDPVVAAQCIMMATRS
jgi:hypothetical protein